MNTTWWGVLTVAAIVIVGVWLYAASNADVGPIGGDTDEHGCLIAAGYSWDEDQQACVRPWEEEMKAEAAASLQTQLANKYSHDLSAVVVTINKIDGDYVSGGVNFNSGQPSSGGSVLAYRNDGEWVIVYDGNGSVNCVELRGLGFPETVLQPSYCDANL